MKITDPQVIRQGEQDLIHSVQEDLDLNAVREILKERMSVAALSSKGGQIVVHNNEIAFRLDFEINLSGSLLFDRDGNHIGDTAASTAQTEEVSPLIRDREDEILTDEDFEDDDLEEADLYDADLDDADDLDGPLASEDDEEDLDIDLDDYDLGREKDYPAEAPAGDLELALDHELDQGLELDDDALSLEDLDEEDERFMEDDDMDLEDESGFEAVLDDDDEENPFDDDDMDSQDLDDDINDILKESREFWEQKKES